MDPHDAHIYSILKFGCRASSWLSAIPTICPSLELVGSRKSVIDQLQTYVTDEWKANYRVTKQSVNDMRAEFEEKKAKVEKRMKKPVPRKSHAVISGMRKRGYFDHDEALRDAVEDMETNGVSRGECS